MSADASCANCVHNLCQHGWSATRSLFAHACISAVIGWSPDVIRLTRNVIISDGDSHDAMCGEPTVSPILLRYTDAEKGFSHVHRPRYRGVLGHRLRDCWLGL